MWNKYSDSARVFRATPIGGHRDGFSESGMFHCKSMKYGSLLHIYGRKTRGTHRGLVEYTLVQLLCRVPLATCVPQPLEVHKATATFDSNSYEVSAAEVLQRAEQLQAASGQFRTLDRLYPSPARSKVDQKSRLNGSDTLDQRSRQLFMRTASNRGCSHCRLTSGHNGGR
jgi:hypothetical protein